MKALTTLVLATLLTLQVNAQSFALYALPVAVLRDIEYQDAWEVLRKAPQEEGWEVIIEEPQNFD